MNIETSDFVSVLRFMQYVKKHYKLMLLSFLVLSVISFYCVKNFRTFDSTVNFFVNNLPAAQMTQNNNSFNSDMEAVKLNSLQLFYSTQVIERVIDKLDLYSCYGVNKNDKYAKQKLVKAIRSSMNVKYKKTGGFTLMVSCSDLNLSADIANAIMDETDMLNKRFIEEDFMRKAEMMNNLITLSHGNAGKNNPDLVQNIESLKQLSSFLEIQKAKSAEQKDLEARLYKVLALLQQNLEDVTRTRDYYDVVLKNYFTENFRFFYVISRAIPDDRNYFASNILLGAGIGLGITLLFSMLLFYVQRQLSYISVLGLHKEKTMHPVREIPKDDFVKSHSTGL